MTRVMPDPASHPADLVLQLFREGASRVPAASLGRHVDALRSLGVIVDGGVAPSVFCDACDLGHMAQVEHNVGSDEFGWRCPEADFVVADRERLRLWKVDMEAIVRSLASAAFDPRDFDAGDARDGVWRLGRRPSGERRVEALISRNGSGASATAAWRAVAARSGPSHLTLVLVAEHGIAAYSPMPGMHVEPLDGVLGRSDFRGPLIDAALLDELAVRLLSPATKSKGGRPSYDEKIQVVIEHLGERGLLRTGRNEGTRAIRAAWSDLFAGESPPGESTIKAHLRDFEKSAGRTGE
ncbi:hypothetical protein P2H44_24675 [Albimonas sp. CAU 1670]|uniref:hypothetical protein n=1 Tax=Albimonas sp. CAU 1670 TaxID=3032599 RepID=UPI0023DA0CC3|nr:hypothetical protein [Albimonas sp. CAU 1670]MDF2235761.1 hypothetical protein [Albimonas sp. CAU 1670]